MLRVGDQNWKEFARGDEMMKVRIKSERAHSYCD